MSEPEDEVDAEGVSNPNFERDATTEEIRDRVREGPPEQPRYETTSIEPFGSEEDAERDGAMYARFTGYGGTKRWATFTAAASVIGVVLGVILATAAVAVVATALIVGVQVLYGRVRQYRGDRRLLSFRSEEKSEYEEYEELPEPDY